MNGELEIYTSSGKQASIRKYVPKKAQKSLGYLQKPDGNIKEEVKSLNNIASKWPRKMSESTLTRVLMWHILRSTVWIYMRYRLKSAATTKPRIRNIERCLYRGIIPRLGAMRSIPYLCIFDKNIVGILPQEDNPDQVLGIQTTPKTIPGRFSHNGQGNGTSADGPIHNIIE